MSYQQKAKEILILLTTEEKISLQASCDNWHTTPIDRVGLPSIMLCDGPHGLRKQPSRSDHLGMGYSIPAVCMPSISKLACSWDKELLTEVGSALADQCLSQDVSVLLAPGINIKRNALCGRNFEYFSEDPYLAGELASHYVNGVQQKNVGVALKHFAVNNQEYARLVNNSVVDDRAMHEIYLRAFHKVITQANPYTIMCSYNSVNSILASQNSWLLTDLLRNKWGYNGLTMSDWGAVSHRPKSIASGLDLQMPYDDSHTVANAIQEGTLSMQQLDDAVLRIIELVLRTCDNDTVALDLDKQHQQCANISSQCTVLAKNTCNMLPLLPHHKVAVIGELARTPHYQGGGSSKVNAHMVTSLLDALDDKNIEYSYQPGYTLDSTEPNQELIDNAIQLAEVSDKVILVVGLPDICEYESFDRATLSMPDSITQLIQGVTAVNGNVVAVVQSGSPVDMQWSDGVKAVLLDYMGGEADGIALANILYGDQCPSGRLAETWPINHMVQSSSPYFANNACNTSYKESIFVGYRYYDYLPQYVKYPFGYGLSYTSFQYSNISIDQDTIDQCGTINVHLTITNSGQYDGSEVVQIYCTSLDNKLPMPTKQLVAFVKVFVPKGECVNVCIPVHASDLAYYNSNAQDMVVDGGNYQLHVAKNSQDILHTISFAVKGDNTSTDQRDTLSDYYNIGERWDIPQQQWQYLYNKPLPQDNIKTKQFTVDSTLGSLRHRLIGRIVYYLIVKQSLKLASTPDEKLMTTSSLQHTPLRSISMSQGMSRGTVEGIVDVVNGRIFKGLLKIHKYNKINKLRQINIDKESNQ